MKSILVLCIFVCFALSVVVAVPSNDSNNFPLDCESIFPELTYRNNRFTYKVNLCDDYPVIQYANDDLGSTDITFNQEKSHLCVRILCGRKSGLKKNKGIFDAIYFYEGDRCVIDFRGPPLYRSSEIQFQCGLHTEIMSVVEETPCRYQIVMRTPIACIQQFK